MASTTRQRYSRRKFDPGLPESADDVALALCPASRDEPENWAVSVRYRVYSRVQDVFRRATFAALPGPRIRLTPFEDGWVGIYAADWYINRPVLYETFEGGEGDISEQSRPTRTEAALVFWAVWQALDEI